MAITRVQDWKYTMNALGDPAVTLTAAVAAGDLIAVGISFFGDGSTVITSLTDQLGNTYNQRIVQRNTSQDKAVGYYDCVVTVTGTPVITLDLASVPSNPTIAAGVYRGTHASPWASQSPGANGTTTVPDYGSLTPSEDGMLVIAGTCGIFSTATADTGFTLVLDAVTDSQMSIFEEIQTTATARNTFMTAPSSLSGWAAWGITEKAAAASATTWGAQLSDQHNKILANL